MYRIRIKKVPKAKVGLSMGDQSGFGLYVAGPGNYDLPKAQDGKVVDHFKQEMLKKYGKYLVTDKGANRTYYGYRTPDGKMVENNFEVLTGKAGNTDYYSPYSLAETESKPLAFQEKIRVTPVGSFPVSYNPDIYGNPGLKIENSGGLAMHVTYDPAVRNAYYNNNNPLDNYASYGCINCHKPDVDRVLKGFGNNDRINIIDSRKSVEENAALMKDNDYLYKHPEAARMLFENPGAQVVNREWNAQKGVYEGKDSDYDPRADAIIDKKDLATAFVVARKNNPGTLARNNPAAAPQVAIRVTQAPVPVAQTLTPLQQTFNSANGQFADNQDPSIVDYLNNLHIDSSKANRMRMAHDLGIDNYNYTADDNLKMLRMLQEQSAIAKNNTMQAGGTVPANSSDQNNVRQSIQPVKRDEANIEAERGETVTGDFDQDGMTEHLEVGGKRHSEGGTPLNVPSGSFIFSDTKKMRIKGPVLQEFGKSADSKKSYTPAELAKQYELNKYKAILQDPNSDKLEKDTAQLMLDNHQTKLGKLALLQEAMKGFPNGIPGIALPLIQTGAGSPPELEVGAPTKAAYGYYDPPVDPYKGDINSPRQYQQQNLKLAKGFNKYNAPWLNDFGYKNTPQGLNQALQEVGYQGDPNNVKEVQTFLVNENLKHGNVGLFDNLLHNYGVTNQGIRSGISENFGNNSLKSAALTDQQKADLTKIYADGMFGVRSGEMLQSLLRRPLDPAKPSATPIPVPFGRPDMSHFIPKPPPDETPAPEPAPTPTPRPIPTGTQPQWIQPQDKPMHLWTQDEINMAGALGNRYNLKKYMPTYVSPEVVTPTPTFFDPTRQLAANQEQAAAQNMMTGMFAGPQRARAVGSNVQGQAAGNAANILGQVANQNVGVANQFAGVTAEILNNKALQDANARKTYMNELATVNQQYDNSKMMGNDIVRGNLVNAISNAQKTYWLNKTNDQYNIDPTTGRLFFTTGKSLGDKGAAAAAGPSAAQLYSYHYNDFKKLNPGLEKLDDKAHEYAMRQIQMREKSGYDNQQALMNYMGAMGGRGQ